MSDDMLFNRFVTLYDQMHALLAVEFACHPNLSIRTTLYVFIYCVGFAAIVSLRTCSCSVDTACLENLISEHPTKDTLVLLVGNTGLKSVGSD